MSIALVQHRNIDSASSTSTTLAYTSNPQVNNLLIVVARAGGTTALPYTISDTIGNTWNGLTSNTVTGIGSLQIFWAVNISVAADTVTFAISGAANTLRLAIYEYQGAATSSPVDAENNSATAGSGNASAVSITPAADNELVLGAVSTGASTTATAGASFTLEDPVPAAPNSRLCVEDWIQTTATATNAPETLTGGVSWMEAIAVFKVASAGGSTALLGIIIEPRSGPEGVTQQVAQGWM